MDLATLIVLFLGPLFFGGILCLALMEREKARTGGPIDAVRVAPGDSKKGNVPRQKRPDH